VRDGEGERSEGGGVVGAGPAGGAGHAGPADAVTALEVDAEDATGDHLEVGVPSADRRVIERQVAVRFLAGHKERPRELALGGGPSVGVFDSDAERAGGATRLSEQVCSLIVHHNTPGSWASCRGD